MKEKLSITHPLVRLGAKSINDLLPLENQIIVDQLDRLHQILNTSQKLKEEISYDIFEIVKITADEKTRNLLINFRRDFFNERVKEGQFPKELDLLGQEITRKMETYWKNYQTTKIFSNEIERSLKEFLLDSRRFLQKKSLDKELNKGLLLASRMFVNSLHDYRNTDPSLFNKKHYRTELTLYRYLSRMSTKTSPFSTFNNITLAKLSNENELLKMSNGTDKVESHVRLNNFIFKHISNLLFSTPELANKIRIRANSTISDEGENFLFLINVDNRESFQRIRKNGFLTLIISSLNGKLTLEKLVQKLLKKVDASDKQILKQLNDLLAYGFLEYDLQVSGVDPDWDVKLVNYLKKSFNSENERIDFLIVGLVKLRELSNLISAGGDSEERTSLIDQAYEIVTGIDSSFKKLADLSVEDSSLNLDNLQATSDDEHKGDMVNNRTVFKNNFNASFSFTPENIFYEDTTRNLSVTVNEHKITELIRTMAKLIKSFSAPEAQIESYKMLEYFKCNFDSVETVPFLKFYENYYKHVKKIELNLDSDSKQLSVNQTADNEFYEKFILDFNEKLKSKSKISDELLLLEKKTRESFAENELNISLDEFGSEKVKTDKSKSIGVFMQLFNDDGRLKGVINGSFLGYGKMYSRFLHVVDSKLTSDIRRLNRFQVPQDTIYAENSDTSYFNANIHPHLLDYQLNSPGSHSIGAQIKQIAASELDVEISPSLDALLLKHRPTGKTVVFFDLGFQAMKGRSPMYNLLNNLSGHTNNDIFLIRGHINRICMKIYEEQSPGLNMIRILPRILLAKDVVLQRKTWILNKGCLPGLNSNFDDFQLFRYFHRWRRENGIPDEVFLVALPGGKGVQSKQKENKQNKDGYKPQYINFKSPLSVCIFNRIINSIEGNFNIIEMLPNSSQMNKLNGLSYVSELVLQWYEGKSYE